MYTHTHTHAHTHTHTCVCVCIFLKSELTGALRVQAAAGITGARVGIPTVAAHIWKTEGVKGFFVGAPIRVGMKAPNLGVALLVVEILTQVCHGGIKLPAECVSLTTECVLLL